MLSTDLLDILVCPACHGALLAGEGARQLCCLSCGLAFPVREGIPVMLLNEAERITAQGAEGKAR
jgi:uncharacterized protein YbaR (Trm112 family)